MLGALSLISGGMSLVGGATKFFAGNAQERKYNNMIANYERQDLNNLGDNLTLSMYGSDLIKDETARNTATILQGIRQGGARSIIGATGKVANMGIKANESAMMNIDNQQQKRQYAIMQDGANIRGMQENRENQDLAGMGAMALAGQQTKWAGVSEGINGAMAGARAYGQYLEDKD